MIVNCWYVVIEPSGRFPDENTPTVIRPFEKKQDAEKLVEAFSESWGRAGLRYKITSASNTDELAFIAATDYGCRQGPNNPQ